MLLHILFTICDGLNVGSSTTSTISAPRGSSSTSSTLAIGSGGGGGGATISAGTDVTRFKALVLLAAGTTVDFGGEECLIDNLVFSMSVVSSVVSSSCDDFCCCFFSI